MAIGTGLPAVIVAIAITRIKQAMFDHSMGGPANDDQTIVAIQVE